MKKLGLGFAAVFAAVVLFGTIAAVLAETNPPVLQEPAWDSPQTRELAVRACFDCHSNETQWPWFTKLPVGSWLAVYDTVRGRNHLNFSEWGLHAGGGEEDHDAEHEGGHEMAEAIESGEMPPRTYILMHPEAVLTDAEQQQLIEGLQKSLTLP